MELPEKTAEQRWAIWDSTRLNDFPFRDDDIVIATWSKSGTTWMQQLVAQLVFQGDPDVYGQALSPWPEFRLMPLDDAYAMAEAQEHRRFIKTHSPLNCIPFKPTVKYLFIGRDARDVAWSMFNHQRIFTPQAYDMFNEAPGLAGARLTRTELSRREYFGFFLRNGYFDGLSPDVSFFPCVKGWWDARKQPNILLVHFNNLRADFEGEARQIAEFLGIDVAEETWPAIVKHCQIDYMRNLSRQMTQLDARFEGGGQKFINKGTNGRWKDELTPDEIKQCDEIARRELGEACAHWLETGEMS